MREAEMYEANASLGGEKNVPIGRLCETKKSRLLLIACSEDELVSQQLEGSEGQVARRAGLWATVKNKPLSGQRRWNSRRGKYAASKSQSGWWREGMTMAMGAWHADKGDCEKKRRAHQEGRGEQATNENGEGRERLG